MGSDNRKRVVDDLNSKFQSIISSQMITLDAAYHEIVKEFPYNCGLHPLVKVKRSFSTMSSVKY